MSVFSQRTRRLGRERPDAHEPRGLAAQGGLQLLGQRLSVLLGECQEDFSNVRLALRRENLG